MKKLFFILFLVPFLSFGQTQDKPFKHANTIIINTTDSGAVIMQQFITALSKNGFSVAFADKETGVINSNAKAVRNETTTLNALITDKNKVVLTGTFKAFYVTSTLPVTFRGMNGSSFMNTWELMRKVAESYPNATFSYEKR